MFTRPYRLQVVGIVLTAAVLLLAAGVSGCGATQLARSNGSANLAASTPPASATQASSGPFAIPAPSQMYSRLHVPGQTGERAPAASGFAALLPGPHKAVSSVMTHTGSEFEAGLSQRITAVDTQAAFDSAWLDGYSAFDTVAYASYRFDLRWRQGDLKIRTDWSRPSAVPALDFTKVWLGASNWQKNRWDWYSAAAGGNAMTAPGSIDAYRHPDTEEMLVVVVKLPQSPHQLKRIWLSDYSMRGDWWMAGRDEGHRSCSPTHGPQSQTVLWQSRLADGLNLQQPVYDSEGYLYFGGAVPDSTTRKMASILPNGSPRWNIALTPLDMDNAGCPSPAMSYDGGIFYALHHGPLYSVNLDKTINWEYSGPGAVDGSPALAPDGTCYIIGKGGAALDESYLLAVEPNGTQEWQYAFGTEAITSPALGPDGTVYVGCSDRQLYAFHPDGTVYWNYEAEAPLVAGISVGNDGTAYCLDATGKLTAVGDDGTQAWTFQLPGVTDSDTLWPAIGSDGAVCIPAADGLLYVLNGDGTLRWTYRVGICSAAPTIDADGTIFVSSLDCRVYAVAAGGALKWWYVAAAPLLSQPVLAEDGSLYVTDARDVMYAIGPGTPMDPHTLSGEVKDEADAGLAGVMITISGTEPVITDENGHWSKSGLPDGIYLISPSLAGYDFAPQLDIVTIAGGDIQAADFIGSPQSAPIWPMWGMNRAHTRCSTHIGPTDVQSRWVVQYDGDAIVSEPVIGADGAIYIQYASGILRAFNPDGKERWHYVMWSDSLSTPTIADDGTVYSSTVNGSIYSLTPGGLYKWVTTLPSALSGSPIVLSDGGIIHADTFGGVFALDTTGTGTLLYGSGSGGGSGATPAVADDGTIYFGNGLDTIYALNPDGTVQWSFPADAGGLESPLQTSPSIGADGTVYMGFGTNFYALNPDGTEQWVFPATVEIHSSPAIGPDGTIFFGTDIIVEQQFARYYALHPDGTEKWHQNTRAPIRNSPIVDANGVSFVSMKVNEVGGGSMTAVLAGGGVIWSIDTPGNVYTSATIGADGTLYFGDDWGIAFAIGPGGG